MKKVGTIVKRILFGLLISFVFGISVFVIAGLIPTKAPLPGLRRSTYVTMKDGTKIAVRYTLPANLKEGEKVPAVMESTRYGTEFQGSLILNALLNLKIAREIPPAVIAKLIQSNYAFVAVDARGSGASFGQREMEFSREEINDIGTVIDWIVHQPWSNGKVGAYGMSYSGNTSELAAVSNHPGLQAVAPLYPDFDPIRQNGAPGGIKNEPLVKGWSDYNLALDKNQIKSLFNAGIAPVDGDRGGKLLRQAILGHRTVDIYECLQRMTFFDDGLAGLYDANSLAPFRYREEIAKSQVPFLVRVGWQDAGTVNGALERYLSYPNPQILIIGPWSHAGWHFYDPFLLRKFTKQELDQVQAGEVVAFFDRYLKNSQERGQGIEARAPLENPKEIRYYTFGTGEWKITNVWPPVGFENRILYFGPERSLREDRPGEDSSGADSYRIDYTTTTGTRNRWFTNFGGGAVFYPDRALEDQKLLTYTSAALKNEVEITGAPVVTLNLHSTAEDGAFYVYLEDVAPDGRVTYITEGQLRALHRKVTDEDLGYRSIGPPHSFLRKDGAPLQPGVNAELKIGMYATSVVIRKGHRLRIAIAGHDAANFERIPKRGNPTIEVQRNRLFSSYVELPMKVRE